MSASKRARGGGPALPKTAKLPARSLDAAAAGAQNPRGSSRGPRLTLSSQFLRHLPAFIDFSEISAGEWARPPPVAQQRSYAHRAKLGTTGLL